jgi:hypothetical protein
MSHFVLIMLIWTSPGVSYVVDITTTYSLQDCEYHAGLHRPISYTCKEVLVV